VTIDTDTRPDPRLIDPTPRRLLSPDQLSTYLSIGRTAAYALLKPGGPLRDDVVRVGRSVRIPVDAVEAFIARGGVTTVR
jgi:excisionase family DNA binding protein